MNFPERTLSAVTEISREVTPSEETRSDGLFRCAGPASASLTGYITKFRPVRENIPSLHSVHAWVAEKRQLGKVLGDPYIRSTAAILVERIILPSRFVFSNQKGKFPYVHVIMENETKKKKSLYCCYVKGFLPTKLWLTHKSWSVNIAVISFSDLKRAVRPRRHRLNHSTPGAALMLLYF